MKMLDGLFHVRKQVIALPEHTSTIRVRLTNRCAKLPSQSQRMVSIDFITSEMRGPLSFSIMYKVDTK